MLTLTLLHLIASVSAGVICDDFTQGECKIAPGTEVVKLWVHDHWSNRGVPSSCSVDKCRQLCALRADEFGDGCCQWGVITKDMGLKGVRDVDFAMTAGKSAQSCFYFKGVDNNPDVNLYRTKDYRQVCKGTADAYTKSRSNAICAGSYYLKGFKWASKGDCEKQCDDRAGCDTFCWSNKSPQWDCLLYKSCSRTDSKFSDGSSTGSYNCYKKPGRAEAKEMISNVADAETGSMVVLHGFAVLGLAFVLFGSYKFYCSK